MDNYPSLMFPMDTLTCEIVPNAIGNDSLSCSMPPLEYLQLWSTIGDVLTALVTILLAIFAYRAWRVSRQTLERMKADSGERQRTLLDQIRAQQALAERGHERDRQLASEQRSSDALIEHLRAIRRLQVEAKDPSALLLEERSLISLTWAIWAMYEREKHPQFVELTQDISDTLMAITGYLQKCLTAFPEGRLTKEQLEEVGELYGNAFGAYIGNTTQWQTESKLRPEKESNLRHLLMTLQEQFPGTVAPAKPKSSPG